MMMNKGVSKAELVVPFESHTYKGGVKEEPEVPFGGVKEEP